MLNQLVESKKNTHENKRKSEFFLTTLFVLASVLAGSWTYSLYAKDYAMGAGALEMASLVAPVALEQQTPPKPEPQLKPEKTQASKSNEMTLKDLYEDLERTTAPPKNVIGEKEIVSARPYDLNEVKLGPTNDLAAVGRTSDASGGGNDGLRNDAVAKKDDREKDDAPEVVTKPKVEDKPSRPAPPKSLGVVNGIASNLVKPAYPLPARQIRAEGAVNVQVTIDERGNVVSATAVSGHPLLRTAAVGAARQSKFTPTLLSGQPVKVTGVIVYNFKAQ